MRAARAMLRRWTAIDLAAASKVGVQQFVASKSLMARFRLRSPTKRRYGMPSKLSASISSKRTGPAKAFDSANRDAHDESGVSRMIIRASEPPTKKRRLAPFFHIVMRPSLPGLRRRVGCCRRHGGPVKATLDQAMAQCSALVPMLGTGYVVP